MNVRYLDSMLPDELLAVRVWRFVSDDEPNETAVLPVSKLPVKKLEGVVAATRLRLANGSEVCGLVGNYDPATPELNQHWLTLSVVREDGQTFHLARYHDPDHEVAGPPALAAFLGLALSEVFPIQVSLSGLVRGAGEPAAVVHAEPSVRLTRAEIIALAVT